MKKMIRELRILVPFLAAVAVICLMSPGQGLAADDPAMTAIEADIQTAYDTGDDTALDIAVPFSPPLPPQPSLSFSLPCFSSASPSLSSSGEARFAPPGAWQRRCFGKARRGTGRPWTPWWSA